MRAAVILALAVVVASVCLPAARAAPADAGTYGQAATSPCGDRSVYTGGYAYGTKCADSYSGVYGDQCGNVGGYSGAGAEDRRKCGGCGNDGCGDDGCCDDGCCDDGCCDDGCCDDGCC